MQSNPRIQLVLHALSGGTRAFRSAVANAVEQLRGHLGTASSGSRTPGARLAVELGEFAAGRIDPEKFAPFTDWGVRTPNPTATPVLEQAFKALSELDARGNDLFIVDVASGGSLWHAVATALEEIGRGFSAARTVEASKQDSKGEPAEVPPPGPLSFRNWGKSQRRMAPPLIVHVDGSDLHVPGLAEFMDGRQKIVLVVRGESPPAPLVRFISPGTFVLQTTDDTGLDRLAACEGPAMAALLPEGAACFVHDPAGGPALAKRLQVTHLPSDPPQKALGGISATQQAEDLQQLTTLAAAAGVSAGPPATVPDNPVDKLAAWLIRQANVS